MRRLAAHELQQRLRFDFEVVGRLAAPWLHVAGFASMPDLLVGRTPIPPGTPGAAPGCVLAGYGFPTLAGAGRWQTATIVAFDLLGGGSYPFTPPNVTVIRPYPWNARVHPAVGIVCIGSGWTDANGQMLLAHVLIQVARILNFDEPHSGRDYGYQPDAITYWRTTMHGRPLHPDLVYPPMPIDFTHGVPRTRPAFQVLAPAAATTPRFRVRSEG